MADVTDILADDALVNVGPVGVVAVLVLHPVVQIGEDVAQVADAVLRSLHGVVAEILGLRAGIEHGALLLAVAEHGIGGGLGDPPRRDLVDLLGRCGVEDRRIEPFDSVVVVDAETGRRHPHAPLHVARLGHVVEARIVHDRGGRAVFLRERRRAQRIDRNDGRSAHVVHESQAMPDLVGHHVAQGVVHHLAGQFHAAHRLVGLGRLDEAPVVHQLDNVVEHVDRGVDDLAAARIDPRGPHSVGDADGRIADARIFDVVGVELRVVLRKLTGLDGLFESDAFERLVPLLDGLENGLAPALGEIGVDVEDDRFLGPDELPAAVGRLVRRLDAPAVGVAEQLGLLLPLAEKNLPGGENRHAAIDEARLVRRFGQQHERARHNGRERHVGGNLLAPGFERVGIAQVAADHDVVLEGADLPEERLVRLVARRAGHPPVVEVLSVGVERRQSLVVAQEEVRRIENDRATVGTPRRNVVRLDDRADVVVRQRPGDIGARRIGHVVADQLADLHLVARAGELYPQRIGRFGTDDGVAVVGNLADGRSEQHVASEQCHRELEIVSP